MADEQLARLFDKNDRKGAASLTPDPTRMPLVMPTPVPSADLAPMPTNEEIFGESATSANTERVLYTVSVLLSQGQCTSLKTHIEQRTLYVAH